MICCHQSYMCSINPGLSAQTASASLLSASQSRDACSGTHMYTYTYICAVSMCV